MPNHSNGFSSQKYSLLWRIRIRYALNILTVLWMGVSEEKVLVDETKKKKTNKLK